jgi:hypothetical protein
MRYLGQILCLGFVAAATFNVARAQTVLSVEGAALWQTRNEIQIPGTTGTRFKLTDFGKGPFLKGRLYLGHTWSDRHEIRALYAPLTIKLSGRPKGALSFQGQSFAADQETEALYRFNSYRLTYAYHFVPEGTWSWALGFTAKIRDAEVSLTQGSSSATKKNIGFVPLLNVQVSRSLGLEWALVADIDGLGAPQGRAIDAALFAERSLAHFAELGILSGFVGYRTVEGGADNDEVYSFAWLHSAVVGLRGAF